MTEYSNGSNVDLTYKVNSWMVAKRWRPRSLINDGVGMVSLILISLAADRGNKRPGRGI